MRRLSIAMAFATALSLPPAVFAQTRSLQDLAQTTVALPEIVIYPAKEIVTLDPAKPGVKAVAVVGDRIIGTGTVDELVTSAGKQPFRIDNKFADLVIVPGFIAQHDHPLLAALTMTTEIIAIEDWVLPQGTSKAAKGKDDYLRRLARRAPN